MTKLKFNKKQTELLDKAIESYEIKESRNNLSAKQQRVFIASQMTSADLLGNARLDGEDFEEYKERRKLEKLWTKIHLEGKYAWVSVDYEEDSNAGMFINKGGGTYVKAIHGELKTE
jgi:hypothetical protein